MPWVRLDDRFPSHRKVALLTDKAFRLYVSALCWCSENLTEGQVLDRELPVITRIRGARAAAAELEKAGLWDRTADGWMIHDYLEYNPDRAKVQAQREAGKARQQAWRDRKRAEKDAARNDTSNAQRNGVTDEPESAFADSSATRTRRDDDTKAQETHRTNQPSPQVNEIRNAVGNAAPSPAPTPFSPYGEKGTASKQRQTPDQLVELKQAIAAAGLSGVGWTLRESQWEYTRQAMERVGITAMVQHAAASARLRGIPASAGAWVDGWRSLEAPPADNGVAYLPAAVPQLPLAPSRTDLRVASGLSLAERLAAEERNAQ